MHAAEELVCAVVIQRAWSASSGREAALEDSTFFVVKRIDHG